MPPWSVEKLSPDYVLPWHLEGRETSTIAPDSLIIGSGMFQIYDEIYHSGGSNFLEITPQRIFD